MTDATTLEAALDQMYHCVLAADFGDLPKIVMETERLVGRLDAVREKAVATRLRQKAHRNGLCLQAAARGLRAAQRRLGEMSRASDRLSTYTSGGQRSEVATAPGTLAQRL
jgi:flagellar biosynthesis/type III secretory pathway chaperone